MVVVPVGWADLREPAPVISGLAAQRLLDRGVDEQRATSGSLATARIRLVCAGVQPKGRCRASRAHQVGRGHLFALGPAQPAVGHGGEPHIRIEADLVRGVAGDHGPTARLRISPTRSPGQPLMPGRAGQPLQKVHQARMTPVPVARQAHHLPGFAVDRKAGSARDAAFGIAADGQWLQRRRLVLAPEKLLGRNLGVIRVARAAAGASGPGSRRPAPSLGRRRNQARRRAGRQAGESSSSSKARPCSASRARRRASTGRVSCKSRPREGSAFWY